MSTKYISNNELHRFNLFYRPTSHVIPDYYELHHMPSIDEVFHHADVFYTFVFIRNPKSSIGHWCLLIKYDDSTFEWFDCLNDPIPELLAKNFDDYSNKYNIKLTLHSTNTPFMHRKNWICGKWCMLRVMTLPNNLGKFTKKIAELSKVMKPDDLVDFVVNFKI